MIENIEWIFFDIGSTLVDESACYEKRYSEMIENTNISYDELVNVVIEFVKQNEKGDHKACEHYGLNLPKWHKELEVLYPDAKCVLSKLSQKYNIGIIANQSLGSRERLEQWGILKYIDIVIASAEEGVSKPDLEIFSKALKSADCLAEKAVMIGDRLDNDIVPAKKIGMKTIWIKQGFAEYQNPTNDEETADYIVSNLTQLTDIL
jgi:8-oxo-dGTP diphosphatase/putative hydrolase of the HAD superfamily